MSKYYVDKFQITRFGPEFIEGKEFNSLEEALDYIKKEATKLNDDEELAIGKGSHDKFE